MKKMSINNSTEVIQYTARHHKYVEERKEKERIEQITKVMNEKIQVLKSKYNCNLQIIRKLEQEINDLKPEIKANEKKQLDYYYDLLSYGTDTRGLGIIWIIKALWYLGENISKQRIPNILDDESINFLLESARIEMEKEKLIPEIKKVGNLLTKLTKECGDVFLIKYMI